MAFSEGFNFTRSQLFGSGSMTLTPSARLEEEVKVTHVKPRTKVDFFCLALMENQVRMSWRPARQKIAISARF